MNQAPLSTAAFDSLIASLTEIRDGYVLSKERFSEPLDVAEAYRYVFQVLSAASELFVEATPDRPRFASIASPARKMQGDNPDAIYHFARIQGDLAYRVFGRIKEEVYTSYTIHGAAADGGMAGALLGDVNDRDFEVAGDGTYSLILSATEQPGNWIRLDPAAHCIVVRSYYQTEPPAQINPEISVVIGIETIDPAGPTAALDDATMAARLGEGVAFLRQATLGQGIFGAPSPVLFVSNVPNTVAMPFSFRDSGLPVPGAADIVYSMGRWDLGPDEAMVMTGTLPPCEFVNVMLWNKHMQTLDYRTRQTSLNQAQITLEADGSFRIVIAHSDPGVPNWLDTEGHPRGSIFWRFLLPHTDPTAIDSTVVNVASLLSSAS
jgi:hypothetical protein